MCRVVLKKLAVGVAAHAPWGDVPAAVCGEFSGVSQGLYAFRFSNESELDVFDNNKKPKVVVHRRGASFKPGKFEQGFAARMNNYNAQLHRAPTDGSREWVFGKCIAAGYLLDLSELVQLVCAPARIFERYWTESVNVFLEENELLADPPVVQNGRAEWRYLQADRWTPRVNDALSEHLEGVAARILAMAHAGRFVSVGR